MWAAAGTAFVLVVVVVVFVVVGMQTAREQQHLKNLEQEIRDELLQTKPNK